MLPPSLDPVRLGPEGVPDPRETLGWEVLDWSADYLLQPDGPNAREAWQYTDEQVRFILWWYAFDARRRFVYRRGVLRRMKGWGKDPVAATLAAVEFVGLCRFDGFSSDGSPVAKPLPSSLVQIAAVSKDQTRNTLSLFPGLFSKQAIDEYRIDIGKEILYANHGRSVLMAVTSSPRALEGARSTFVIQNETQHWLANNDGHAMAKVIRRNTIKARDGAARVLALTNAHDPGESSVAEQDFDAYLSIQGGRSKSTGFLYDSLEAPPGIDLADETQLRAGILAARGDSDWLDVDGIMQEVYDPTTPPSESRRYYLNQITAAEDAWLSPDEWDACAAPDISVSDGDEVVAFFDGSKSDDATALVGCRLSDGHLFLVGCWQRPPQTQVWNVPRELVDGTVDLMFGRYKVLGFFADPGTGSDDEGERYWDRYIDGWASRFGEGLLIEATGGTVDRRHAVMWDMRGTSRQEAFTFATMRCYSDITERQVTHDGDATLKQHMVNARRRPNKWGVSIGKAHRESARKIDAAVCAIGARMVRRLVLASPEWQKRSETETGSRVWGF